MDLYFCFAYTLAVFVGLLVLGNGSIVSLSMIAFVPGYMLVAALFPSREISWTERVALSVAVSIATVTLLGLALDFTTFGIRLVPLVVVVSLATLIVGVFACFRRLRLPAANRVSGLVSLQVPSLKGFPLADRLIVAVLVIGICASGGLLVYLVSAPRTADSFTEFYVLGPNGNAWDYPTRLNVSQSVSVILGVVNHEHDTVAYTIRVDLVGLEVVYNSTLQANETIETNRTNWSWANLTLESGRVWTGEYEFRINATGLWEVQFLLFKDLAYSAPYRELHLYVRVPWP